MCPALPVSGPAEEQVTTPCITLLHLVTYKAVLLDENKRPFADIMHTSSDAPMANSSPRQEDASVAHPADNK